MKSATAGKQLFVKMLGRPCCSSCDEAKFVLRRVKNFVPFQGKIIDITGNNTEYEQYQSSIPVIMVNDRVIYRADGDKDKLREKDIKDELLKELDSFEKQHEF